MDTKEIRSLDPTLNRVTDEEMPMDVKVVSATGNKLNETGVSADEHAIKVRKPYTITKQRERWTEEEHGKFLEALKLYGRAWQRIEEHIGTKNAVQIRSHAQKFFTKVVRESSGKTVAVKAIEIPPPRPKRKPSHPYPRNLGRSSTKGMPIPEQPKWASLVIPAASEQDNGSPKSVLSSFALDGTGSSASTPLESCASPALNPSGSAEQGSKCLSSATPFKKNQDSDDRPASAGLSSEDKSPMELDLGTEDEISLKEGKSMEAQAKSLKLFGMTVLVTDSQSPPASSAGSAAQSGNSTSTAYIADHQSTGMAFQDVNQSMLQKLVESVCEVSSVDSMRAWNPYSADLPLMFGYLPFNVSAVNALEAGTVPFPLLWPTHGVSPFQFVVSQQDPSQTAASDQRKMANDNSWTSSNTDSAGEVVDSESPEYPDEVIGASLSLKRNKSLAFAAKKASSASTRGFMPYKRCTSYKEVRHAQMTSREEDGPCMHLYL